MRLAVPASMQPRLTDVGLLLIRVMVGFVGFYHGAQKIFGAFGGGGMAGFIDGLTSMGVPLPTVSAWAAALAEFLGGILIAIGLFTRVSAFFFAFTMYVAAFMVHGSAFGLQNNGMEYALTLAVVLTAIILTGPGRLSVDARLFGTGRRA